MRATGEIVLDEGHDPLAPLLQAYAHGKLDVARRRAAKLGRAELIEKYQAAYASGKLMIAYVMAGGLIERGCPPSAWFKTLALDGATLAQRRILVLGDIAWIRHHYPAHHESVRYQRIKAMLTGSEMTFLREAEYLLYEGKRTAWQMVQSLSMTERQMFDAAYLRATPIKLRAAATEAMSKRVLDALRDNLSKTRRVSFGLAEALASAGRQHTIWLCSRMVKDGSPTEIARRFSQITGTEIPRWTVAKQLAKVRRVLREKELI